MTRTALITGASRGLGAALARALAPTHHIVAVAKTTGALVDDLIDDIAIIGTADECRERLRWAAETGIHTHIIAPLSPDPKEAIRCFEAFRPEVFSLAA